VFCEIHPPDRFPLLFYREPKAPDLEITAAELDLEAIARVPLLWTCGTALSQEPSRTATLAALAAARQTKIHDLDHRPMFWSSAADARAAARGAIAKATIVIGNPEEVEMAVGTAEPDAAAEALLALGPEIVVVKRGGDGVLARTRGGERIAVPPVPVEVLCGLGAGDAFGGAFCHGLLSGWPLARTLAFANAAGAIVASRLACADAMPTVAEVDALLATLQAGVRV